MVSMDFFTVMTVMNHERKRMNWVCFYPKNHWALLWTGLTLYSRVLGSPNHLF